jgi:hypothetical protein
MKVTSEAEHTQAKVAPERVPMYADYKLNERLVT